jgi:hypothetical protein
MTLYDLLARHSTRLACAVAGLVLLGLLARLLALPLALAALLTGRLVAAADAALTRLSRPVPATTNPPAPRWEAANTRTRQAATVH